MSSLPPLIKRRPKYLNLLQIHLPIMGMVSILHRLTGVLLLSAIPGLVYLLELSLQDAQGFAQVQAWLSLFPVKLLGVVVVWGLFYHTFAGIRFLLLDLHWGVNLAHARKTAWAVMIIGGLLLLLLLLGLLL